MALPTHKTKIVCAIDPASESAEVMEHMIRAGMNIARLNFSHADFNSHKKVIESLRASFPPDRVSPLPRSRFFRIATQLLDHGGKK